VPLPLRRAVPAERLDQSTGWVAAPRSRFARHAECRRPCHPAADPWHCAARL